MKGAWLFLAAGVMCLPALADDECPTSVKAAVEKTFPGSSLRKCKAETVDGKQMYEVKLKSKDGYRTRLDLDPTGMVTMTQQVVTENAFPPVVLKTFKEKHKGYKLVRTEKWTHPDGKVTYRVTYMGDAGKKAAVYTSEGVLIEEVEPKLDDDEDDD